MTKSTAPKTSDTGLHGKYIITKASNNEPIGFPAFVLRVDGKDEDAIEALRVYGERRGGRIGEDIAALISRLDWGCPPAAPAHSCAEAISNDEAVNSELEAIARGRPHPPSPGHVLLFDSLDCN